MAGAFLSMPVQDAYQKHLTNEIKSIITHKLECTQSGYDKIYADLTLLSMLYNNLDFRYDAIMALRARCADKKSSFEIKQ